MRRVCPGDVYFRRETVRNSALSTSLAIRACVGEQNGAKCWADSTCTSFWCGQGAVSVQEVMRAPCRSPCSRSLAAAVSARRWGGLRGRTGERSAPQGHCLGGAPC